MTIEELKEIIFQNRCVFLNTKQPCLSDDMSANGCEECSDKIVDEIVEKIRADERAKTVQFIIDEFNRRTVCLGRATAKTYVINTLNEILKELKENKNE